MTTQAPGAESLAFNLDSWPWGVEAPHPPPSAWQGAGAGVSGGERRQGGGSELNGEPPGV